MSHGGTVLIIKLGAFGDVLLAQGAIADIRAHHADATVAVLTGAAYAPLLARCPSIDVIVADARAPLWRLDRHLALARRLRHLNIGRVYDLQRSQRTDLYRRWLLGDLPWCGERQRLRRDEDDAPRPAALDRLADQLEAARVPVRHTRRPDLSWMIADVAALLRDARVTEPYVVLLPGSSRKHPEKRWPHFAPLAQRLIGQGLRVVTLLGPDERELAAAIPGVTLMDARLDSFHLAGVLARAAFVVGNDSGPTHLAALLGSPGLALLGGYSTRRNIAIAGPAFATLAAAELTDLSVERVAAAVLDHWPGRAAAS